MPVPGHVSKEEAAKERVALAAEVKLDDQGRITQISEHAARRLGSLPASLVGRSLAEVAIEARDVAQAEAESLAYAISHDLRAPLRHLQGFTSLLKSEAGDRLEGEPRHYMDVMENAARRMGLMIDAVLEYSRIQRASLRPEALDMAALVREAIVRAQGTEPQRRFEWQMGALEPTRGDRVLVSQLWDLLLANAVKFTKSCDPAVVEIGSTRQGGLIEYRIRDNGAGLDQAYAGKLFTLFQRLHPDSEFQGLGRGLALAARIVARHGGSIQIEGKAGSGACVAFTLPA